MNTSVSEQVFAIFARRGAEAYFGERVSMLEHCLQAAHFATLEGAPPRLIVAALLHDIGHLLEDLPNDIADWTSDAHHERVGGHWLAQRFRAEVADPVRLHVPAKRYLCASDASYAARLSPASVQTLKLQGGPMSRAEALAFESERYCRDAIRVRRWDDAGKVAGLKTAALSDYVAMIEQLSSEAP
jgi:[1-hydroxy-2-(trimethylamino)ethyl]phosphonate dioxygenase